MILVKKGESMLEVCQKHLQDVDFSCGGKGICGKCKVRVDRYVEPTEQEKKHLSAQDIEAGMRLACCHQNVPEDLFLQPLTAMDSFSIVSNDRLLEPGKEAGYAAGLDIGTTTVVMSIYEISSATKVKEYRFLNPQKKYGADVISRIQACHELGVDVLHKPLIDKIEACLQENPYPLRRLSVCGNATMTHIFMNEDPYSIGVAPYVCKVDTYREFPSTKFFDLKASFPVQVLPPISAYVGSDILMGIMSVAMKPKSLLVDLGTNGEMAYFDGERYQVTSAACGPAFEGGQMKCGIGAVDGAIDEVWLENGELKFHTIHDKAMVGVCGSGYIAWIASLLKQKTLEETGYLAKDSVLAPHIVLQKKDVREFQLAKSSVASAIDCLIHDKPVDQVYLAGGFSQNLSLEACMELGLFVQDWKDKVSIVHNSALQGICQFALNQDHERMKEILTHSDSLLLMNDALFFERFVDNMVLKKRSYV